MQAINRGTIRGKCVDLIVEYSYFGRNQLGLPFNWKKCVLILIYIARKVKFLEQESTILTTMTDPLL